MRSAATLVFCFVVVGSALAQDDNRFAQGLARRGYMDLAKEVYKRLGDKAGASKEQRLAADFGMLNMLVTTLRREGDPKRRLERAMQVKADVEKWIIENKASPRHVDAVALLSEVHQVRGRTYLDLGDSSGADSAFMDSIRVCDNLVQELKRSKSERAKELLMYAEYNYITAQFYRINSLKDDGEIHFAGIDQQMPALERFFEDFMWDFENYLTALDGSTYMGRIYQAMAEMAYSAGQSDAADKYWNKCFVWIGRGVGPLQDKEYRGMPDVQEVGLRCIYYQMVAKIDYGKALRPRGGPYKRQFEDAVKLAEEAFRLVPGAREKHWGTSILLELVKAQMSSGNMQQARRIIAELIGRNDPVLRRRVQSVMGEYGGVLPVKDQLAIAGESYARGAYYSAIRMYQNILQVLEAGSGVASNCWFRIGMGYYLTGRYYEALIGLSKFLELDQSSDDAKEAATKKARALGALAKLTGEARYKSEKQKFDRWLADRGWAEGEALRNQAIDLERKFKHAEAADLWSKMGNARAASSGVKAEALARVAFNRFKLAEAVMSDEAKAKPLLEKAAAAFEAHLQFVRGLGKIEPAMVDDCMASFYFGTRVLLRNFKDNDKALEFSNDILERFSNGKPDQIMSVLVLRMEALVLKRQPLEAERLFTTVKKIYEEQGVGANNFKNAVLMLAESFDNMAKWAQKSKPDMYDQYFSKAADYRLRASELSGGAGGGTEYESTLTLANTIFEKAVADSQSDPKAAVNDFNKARQLFEKLVGPMVKEVHKDGGEELEYTIRFFIAKCLMGEGDLEKAYGNVQQMMADHQDDLDLFELQGDIQMKLARKRKGNEQSEMFKAASVSYGKAAAVYQRMAEMRPDYKDSYYRNLYLWCQCLFEYSDGFTRLKNYFKSARARGIAPKWDGGKWADKLNALEQAVKLKDPK